MTLTELKAAIDRAIERANEEGDAPDTIIVYLQISPDYSTTIWSSTDVELHYDGNLMTSGCVLTAL
jgi:hypothetical protein